MRIEIILFVMILKVYPTKIERFFGLALSYGKNSGDKVQVFIIWHSFKDAFRVFFSQSWENIFKLEKLCRIQILENYLMRKVLSGKIKIRFLYKGITRGYVMRNGRNGMGNWRVGMLLGVRKGMVWD